VICAGRLWVTGVLENLPRMLRNCWVAAYALDLMRIALELAKRNGVYVDMAVKCFEHFLYIAGAINRVDESAEGLWDEQDQFFYDVLSAPMVRVNRCACWVFCTIGRIWPAWCRAGTSRVRATGRCWRCCAANAPRICSSACWMRASFSRRSVLTYCAPSVPSIHDSSE